MVKVVKFGGSSLASAEQFTKVGDIIRSDESRKYVVPSAPGKRNSKDTKVTDMLYACYDLAENDQDFKVMLRKIKDRYDSIINGLHLKLALDEEFKIIAENFKAKAGVDYAASRGEYLNGIIMANYLGYEFIDSATVIFFDENGNFDAEKTDKVLSKKLEQTEKAVIPGFYGAGPDGKVVTFSRGGSDITGSIVSKACHASMYENWTDVSGCLVSKTIFDTLIQKHLSLNIIIIHHLSSRFYRIINHLTNLVFDTSKERIEYSLKLAHHNLGNFYLTHEQIALLSGLNRVTVSKTIKDVSYDFDK